MALECGAQVLFKLLISFGAAFPLSLSLLSLFPRAIVLSTTHTNYSTLEPQLEI